MAHVPAAISSHLEAIDFDEEGGLLLAASSLNTRYWDGSLWYFKDPESAPDILQCTSGTEVHSGVAEAKWLPGTKTVIAGCDSGAVLFMSYEEETRMFRCTASKEEHDDYVTSLSLSADKTKLASASCDKSVKLWDLQSYSPEKTYKGHMGAVKSVCWHHTDTNLYSTCGKDGRVILWDLRLQKPAKLLSTSALSSLPTCVAWQPGVSDKLLVGTETGDVVVQDITNSRATPITVNVHSRDIHRIVFSKQRPDWFATASDDCTMAVTKLTGDTPKVIYHDRRHKDFARGLSWHPVDNRLFSCGYDFYVLHHTVLESECLASPLATLVVSDTTDNTDTAENMETGAGDADVNASTI